MSKANIDRLFSFISLLAVIVSGMILLFLLTAICWNGIQAITPEFIFTASKSFGAGGGIFYQILGTACPRSSSVCSD